MSKLNINAFEFVPGKRAPIPAPVQAPLPPVERPPPPDVVVPPPTISLNIGGSKLTPPAPAPAPQVAPPVQPPPTVAAPKPAAPSPAPTPSVPPSVKAQSQSSSPAPSKSFTLEKSKTDTSAIVSEVHKVADQELLKDLFGDGEFAFLFQS
jgi:peptide chain release factor subunit 3